MTMEPTILNIAASVTLFIITLILTEVRAIRKEIKEIAVSSGENSVKIKYLTDEVREQHDYCKQQVRSQKC